MKNDNFYEYIGVTAIILIPMAPLLIIGSIIVHEHNYVKNLPEGLMFPNKGILVPDIGSIISSSEIRNVPIFDIDNGEFIGNFTVKYPAPPTKLNLKGKRSVREWQTTTMTPENGMHGHFDITTGEAWTEQAGKGGAIAMLVFGCL